MVQLRLFPRRPPSERFRCAFSLASAGHRIFFVLMQIGFRASWPLFALLRTPFRVSWPLFFSASFFVFYGCYATTLTFPASLTHMLGKAPFFSHSQLAKSSGNFWLFVFHLTASLPPFDVLQAKRLAQHHFPLHPFVCC